MELDRRYGRRRAINRWDKVVEGQGIYICMKHFTAQGYGLDNRMALGVTTIPRGLGMIRCK